MSAHAALMLAALADPAKFKGETAQDRAWLESMLVGERMAINLSAALCGLEGKAYDDAR